MPGLIMVGSFSTVTKVGHDIFFKANRTVWDQIVLTVVSYIFGHIIAAVSSFTFEKLILHALLKYPTNRLFPDISADSKFQSWKPRRLTKLFKSFAQFMGRQCFFRNYLQPYSPDFQQKVETQFEKIFEFKISDSHDLFWLCWCYVAAKSPIFHRRLMHYVDLYGFSRNMSFSFLILAALPLRPFGFWMINLNMAFWSWSCLGISFIMFVNYTKLLRRTNDEVYRAFVICSLD